MNRQPTDQEIDQSIQLRDSELKGYVYLIFPFGFSKAINCYKSTTIHLPISIIKDYKVFKEDVYLDGVRDSIKVTTTVLVPEWFFNQYKTKLKRFRKEF